MALSTVSRWLQRIGPASARASRHPSRPTATSESSGRADPRRRQAARTDQQEGRRTSSPWPPPQPVQGRSQAPGCDRLGVRPRLRRRRHQDQRQGRALHPDASEPLGLWSPLRQLGRAHRSPTRLARLLQLRTTSWLPSQEGARSSARRAGTTSWVADTCRLAARSVAAAARDLRVAHRLDFVTHRARSACPRRSRSEQCASPRGASRTCREIREALEDLHRSPCKDHHITVSDDITGPSRPGLGRSARWPSPSCGGRRRRCSRGRTAARSR